MTVTVLACTALGSVSALAGEETGVFTLGEVHVNAPVESQIPGSSVLTLDEIRLLNRETLDDALNAMSGTSITHGGTSRNESNYFIRGMDRLRVPLYIDGIRVYMPYDNRLDMARFTTSDIAEIQVTKGYTSVINGPGAMGGSVNLVSRRPTSALSGDVRTGTSFDANGAFNGFTNDAYVGSMQKNWYIQGSGQWAQKDHFGLSDDFKATPYENGGNRNESQKQDYKINLKVGYVPNTDDEYSINYIDQNGRKSAPPDTVYNNRYWRWPEWGKKSLYWLSKTTTDDGSYVKVRAFYDQMNNTINFYADDTYTNPHAKQGVWSTYNDSAWGGSVEGGLNMFSGRNMLRAALHGRSDTHKERSRLSATMLEPWQESNEDTYSAALENTFRATRDWDLIAGVSYDLRVLNKADDWGIIGRTGSAIHYDRSNDHALNPQMATVYRYSDSGNVSASIERRTRFPTLNERYSNKFGTAYNNPALKSEKSINTQFAIKDKIGADTKVGATLFHSYIDDAITSRSIKVGADTYTQNVNVGSARHKGFELEASTLVIPSLEIGANYTFLLAEVTNKTLRETGIPRHKTTMYADWEAVEAVHVVPSVEMASERWMQNSFSNAYYRGGDLAVANLKVAWRPIDDLTVEGGAKNIFDANYQTTDGFPEEGRNYFANVRVTF